MTRYNRPLKICFIINIICIMIILLVAIVSANIKISTLRVTEEINYLSAKILEQNNYLKIYKSELAIITSKDSLISLYKAYNKLNKVDNTIKVTQIKTIDNLVGYFEFAKRYSNLK